MPHKCSCFQTPAANNKWPFTLMLNHDIIKHFFKCNNKRVE